jgi:hypothetical protein
LYCNSIAKAIAITVKIDHHLNNTTMKTKNVVTALILAVGTFVAAETIAQEQPAIQIYPSGDNLKVVFGYDSKVPVLVDFYDKQGALISDKIEPGTFNKGFVKKYQVDREGQETFWVDVRNNVVSTRFQITASPKGQWISKLESVSYNNPIAKR